MFLKDQPFSKMAPPIAESWIRHCGGRLGGVGWRFPQNLRWGTAYASIPPIFRELMLLDVRQSTYFRGNFGWWNRSVWSKRSQKLIKYSGRLKKGHHKFFGVKSKFCPEKGYSEIWSPLRTLCLVSAHEVNLLEIIRNTISCFEPNLRLIIN